MNEPVIEAFDVATEKVMPLTVGGALKAARENAGLTLESLAYTLKVPVSKLSALEKDEFQNLPDTVFVRALASSICRNLGVDARLILAQLPKTTAPSLKTDESGINTPFRSTGYGPGLMFKNQVQAPIVFAVGALILGIFALIFFPSEKLAELFSASKSSTSTAKVPSLTTTQSPIGNLTAASTPAVVQQPSPEAPNFVASTANRSLSPASSVADVTTSISPVAVHPVNSELLVLKARGTSWVEVTDSKGVVQVRKNITQGEVIGVSGTPPLAVVVGRVDSVEVQAHGKIMDLSSIAKDNVARFEVK
jgi:cytoskeleton protein RodZ